MSQNSDVQPVSSTSPSRRRGVGIAVLAGVSVFAVLAPVGAVVFFDWYAENKSGKGEDASSGRYTGNVYCQAFSDEDREKYLDGYQPVEDPTYPVLSGLADETDSEAVVSCAWRGNEVLMRMGVGRFADVGSAKASLTSDDSAVSKKAELATLHGNEEVDDVLMTAKPCRFFVRRSNLVAAFIFNALPYESTDNTDFPCAEMGLPFVAAYVRSNFANDSEQLTQYSDPLARALYTKNPRCDAFSSGIIKQFGEAKVHNEQSEARLRCSWKGPSEAVDYVSVSTFYVAENSAPNLLGAVYRARGTCLSTRNNKALKRGEVGNAHGAAWIGPRDFSDWATLRIHHSNAVVELTLEDDRGSEFDEWRRDWLIKVARDYAEQNFT